MTTIQRNISAGASALGVAFLSLVSIGCHPIPKDAPNTVASVTITNRSPADIVEAAEAVFNKHEFRGGRTGPSQLTFQRSGSTMDSLVYGDWFDRKVIERAVVTLRQQGIDSTVLLCDARLVAAPGDSVFEETRKIWGSGKKQYQEILNEIQTRLK